MTSPVLATAETAGPTFTPPGAFSGMRRSVRTDWSVNSRLAIRSVVNLPVPRMLVMTPRGVVSTSGLSEKSSPSSVPASQGKRSTPSDRVQRPEASSSTCPETPTNQSWLGAIIVVRVTRGKPVVSWTLRRVLTAVGEMLPVAPRMTERAVGGLAFLAAVTSLRSLDVPPTSAIDSTPELAVAPLSRKVTASLWTPPMRREKYTRPGRPPGVTELVHAPRKVMV